MPAQESLIGMTFGRLKVIANAPKYMLHCICECGTHKMVRKDHLGETKSCGCWRREGIEIRNRTHSMTHTRIYRIWTGMKTRCLNPKSDAFKYYGARGITVCERWKTFEPFLEDIGIGKKGWSLERINNDGNYEPENICWATHVRQARNKRSNVVFTVLGKTGCVAELCEQFGIKTDTAWKRIGIGWPLERVFTNPVRHKR